MTRAMHHAGEASAAARHGGVRTSSGNPSFWPVPGARVASQRVQHRRESGPQGRRPHPSTRSVSTPRGFIP
jgi:hypothetical protein